MSYKSENIDSRTDTEIKTMLRCNHPGIAKIKYINVHTFQRLNFLFLIEEFFEGGTLSEMIESQGLLNKNTVIEMGYDLIDAISHLAQLDIVHRDIKPDNILFRKDSTKPILTDFGIVRDLQATSETGSWLPSGPGTPLFSAPEQLTNDKRLIDWRTDQFALAVTISFCVFGQHPFAHPGFSLPQIVEEVANRGNISRYFQERVAETGLTALETMVSVWPANRYRTPEMLVEGWKNQEG